MKSTEAWCNPSMVNVTFQRMNLTCNLVFTGASVWNRSAVRFKKRFSSRSYPTTRQSRINSRSGKTRVAQTLPFKFVDPSQAGGGATTGGPPIVSVIRQIPEKKAQQRKARRRDFRSTDGAGIPSSRLIPV